MRLLCNGHPLAGGSQMRRKRYACLPGADDDQVILIERYGLCLSDSKEQV